MSLFAGLRHVALKVRDVEKSARFYEQAFGMRRFSAKRDGFMIPMVSPGLRDQITLFTEDAPGETDHVSGAPGEHGGIDHIGFNLKPGAGLEKAARRLLEAGAEQLNSVDIAPGVPSMFFRDPDGYVLQVTRFPRFTSLYIALIPLLDRFGLRKS